MVIGAVVSLFYKPGELPDNTRAEWAIQTFSNDDMRIPSRIYLAEKIRYDDDNTPIITNYWTYDGEKYIYHTGDKEFTKLLYGEIEVKKR